MWFEFEIRKHCLLSSIQEEPRERGRSQGDRRWAGFVLKEPKTVSHFLSKLLYLNIPFKLLGKDNKFFRFWFVSSFISCLIQIWIFFCLFISFSLSRGVSGNKNRAFSLNSILNSILNLHLDWYRTRIADRSPKSRCVNSNFRSLFTE